MSSDKPTLRSRHWFDSPNNPEMTALYVERFLNFGITRERCRSSPPQLCNQTNTGYS